MACCSETMLKRTLLEEAKAKADAADAEWKKASRACKSSRVGRKAAARAASAHAGLMDAMAAADTADGSVVANQGRAEHAKAEAEHAKPLDAQEVSAGRPVAFFAPAASASAASGALSAPVSRRWRSLAPSASGGQQGNDNNSLTAAASCAPSAAASGAPSDVAATHGALMRVYGDGGDREDLSDFQLAD